VSLRKRSKTVAGAGIFLFLFGVFLFVWFYRLSPDEAIVYQNPVFEPVLADPSVIRGEDGYFYAFGTEDDWGDGSGAKLVPIVRSANLTEWEYIGDAFEEKPVWHTYGGIWAPDISFYEGTYYLYYSMSSWGDSNPGIGVATADSPEGPYEDKGPLFRSVDIGVANSIDPMVFRDTDGTPYLFWGSFHGIFSITLSKDGLAVEGEKFQVAGNAFEAPYILKKEGFYYLFGSKGTCCEGANSGYNVAVGRSDTLTGPYLDKNGRELLFSEGAFVLMGHFPNSTVTRPIAGPGHNAIVTDDAGTDWILYHGVDKAQPLLPNGATRRPLMLDPLVWESGWPAVRDLVPSTQPMNGPVWK
jgi:arabinan endo-1,5-alpha-L-arabinosidase